MKNLILAIFPVLLFSTSTFAFADEIDPKCAAKAEKAVARFVEEETHYDKNGFETYDCVIAKNNKAMICEVNAYKGEGAANDTFRVVLNLSCNRVYRVEMIGEE